MYFVHTPKCGGTFVNGVFDRWRRRCPTLTLANAQGHLTYLEYKHAFAEHGLDIDQGYTFSIVRNPWDWHVSFYHYVKGDKDGRHSGHRLEHEVFNKLSFRDYLRWLDDPATMKGPQGYQSRQLSDWVVDEDGNIAVDRVLKQETLYEDVRSLVDEFQLSVTVKQDRPNASDRHNDYRYYYDTASVELVARRHSRDLKMFGYQF